MHVAVINEIVVAIRNQIVDHLANKQLRTTKGFGGGGNGSVGVSMRVQKRGRLILFTGYVCVCVCVCASVGMHAYVLVFVSVYVCLFVCVSMCACLMLSSHEPVCWRKNRDSTQTKQTQHTEETETTHRRDNKETNIANSVDFCCSLLHYGSSFHDGMCSVHNVHFFFFFFFPTQGKASFFKDLHSHPLLPSPTADDTLALERQTVGQFLFLIAVQYGTMQSNVFSFCSFKLFEELIQTEHHHVQHRSSQPILCSLGLGLTETQHSQTFSVTLQKLVCIVYYDNSIRIDSNMFLKCTQLWKRTHPRKKPMVCACVFGGEGGWGEAVSITLLLGTVVNADL